MTSSTLVLQKIDVNVSVLNWFSRNQCYRELVNIDFPEAEVNMSWLTLIFGKKLTIYFPIYNFFVLLEVHLSISCFVSLTNPLSVSVSLSQCARRNHERKCSINLFCVIILEYPLSFMYFTGHIHQDQMAQMLQRQTRRNMVM